MNLTGRMVSRYRVAEEISRGGMGVVYRATDTRLNRDVALKVLPEDLMHDPDRRRRFLQEAQAASAIDHPNIAVVYDADEGDGCTFIAMELIRGEKMSDWLAKGRPPVTRALDLAIEIAAGLARAHERQIVHRDLKPGNVMVTEDGHAKVIDFGIAKLLEQAAAATDDTRTHQDTAPGVVLGTVTYMSPEQTQGHQVDHRSDIFSFGVMLQEMLAGRPPFQGRTSLEVASAILRASAPRLPALGRDVPAEVSTELQRILDKCLAKDPAERYQGMKDVAVDLRAARRRLESGSQPTPAVPASPRRAWLWAVTGAGVVVAATSGVLLWRSAAAPRPGPTAAAPGGPRKPAVAVLYFDNMSGARELDWLRTGIPEMVVTDLSQSQDLEVVSTDRLYTVLASLKHADDRVLAPEVVSQVAERTGVDQFVVGSYMKSGDAVRINLQLQDVRTGRILTSDSVEGPTTASLFQMVDDLSHRIRTKAEDLGPNTAPGAHLLSAPGTAEPTGGLDRQLRDVSTSSIEAYRLYAEGIDRMERGQEAEAAALLQQALALDPSFAMAEAKLSVVEGNRGHSDARDRYAEQALQHADRLTPPQRYYVEGLYYSLRPETRAKSLEAYQKCLELDPGNSAARNNLAYQLQFLERFEEAASHEEAVVRLEPENPIPPGNLTSDYISMGDLDRARTVAELFVKRNPESGYGHQTLGTVLIALGQTREALQELSKAEGLDPADAGPIVARRAIAEIQQGDWTAADDTAQGLAVAADPTRRLIGAGLQLKVAGYQGRCAEMRAAADREVAAAGTNATRATSSRLDRADILDACGQGQAALADARAAADAKGRPAGPAALAALAPRLAAAGLSNEADDAIAALGRLVNPLAPSRDGRLLAGARGRTALARRDFPGAIAELTKAVNLLPARGSVTGPSPHVPLWFALGQAYAGAGRLKEAAPWFQKVADATFERTFDPVEFVRSYYFLGQARAALGDATGSREAYRQFLGYWKDGTIDREEVADAERKRGGS